MRDGQRVEAGDLLFELTNDELANELLDLEIAWQESEVRRVAAVNAGKLGEAQIELGQQAAIEQRLREREREVSSLRVRAPQSGFVVARRLHERINTFVKIGDELCVIGEETAKEVILAIDQAMLRRVESGQVLSVRTTGGAAFAGRLCRLTPRATTNAPHPSLCTVNGGPLANLSVMENDANDESPPLVEPVLDARLALDAETSRKLAAGQYCYAATHADKDSLGHALLTATRVWIAERIDAARNEAGL